MVSVGLKTAVRWASICAAILCAGCAVSVHVGYGNPDAERGYVAALVQPMNALTAASSNANRTCAGGSRPDPAKCYAYTKIEIEDARALLRTMRGIPTPPRFARANRDFLDGLGIFIEGLTRRNAGLAARSSAEYSAGARLINRGLALQRSALTEYPPNAHIVP